MMSLPSWTIIAIGLSLFAAAVMTIMIFVIVIAWKRYREGSNSPFKLNYAKRKPSTRVIDENLPKSLSNSRACSLRSLHAYDSDLAVEAERDSRRILDRSSAFEYWWGDNKFTSPKPSGRFYTMPIFYNSGKKDFGRAGKSSHEKISNLDAKKNAASWAGNINRAGYDAIRGETDITRGVKVNEDLKL